MGSFGRVRSSRGGWLNAGISGPVLAARFGTTPTTIYSHRDKNRLPARRVCDYNYEEDCNHNHFDLIDTPDKAYWLGMLVADGCITNEHEVMLSLHSRDVYLVERFRTTLGSQAKISYRNKSRASMEGSRSRRPAQQSGSAVVGSAPRLLATRSSRQDTRSSNGDWRTARVRR